MKFDKEKIKKTISKVSTDVIDKSIFTVNTTKDFAIRSKDEVMAKLDVNGDGNIDINDVIIIGLKTPGVNILRKEFLEKEFKRKFDEETIKKAIETTPAQAGITINEIEPIAKEVIQYERNCVSGISAALSTPGGVAMIATLPADISQYYGYMLRTAQKLMYLYGFPEINTKENKNTFDSETINLLILCLGTMYGVKGANVALKAMASGLSKGISKKIMNTALTKGIVYPMIKKIAKWFGVNMTKKMLVGMVEKSLPVVGGVIGGGITYATFKPCCDKLQKSLKDTLLSNPNHKESIKEIKMVEQFDTNIDYTNIKIDDDDLEIN